jgi:hypothetical protein
MRTLATFPHEQHLESMLYNPHNINRDFLSPSAPNLAKALVSMSCFAHRNMPLRGIYSYKGIIELVSR